MSKEICISSTPHETRLAILEDDQLTEIYYERENEYTLAGSIYKGRVTRVLPGMQSAFVDLGLERDAFLYVTDFMEEQEDSADFEKIATPDGAARESRPAKVETAPEPNSEETGSRDEGGESRNSSDFEHGTRRWRGRRGRRRGRPQGPREADVQGREPAAIQPAELDGIRESIASEPVTLPEHGAPGGVPATRLPVADIPIILPGESLSKYGGHPVENTSSPQAQAAATTVTKPLPKPSTLVEVPTGWDGGSQLPGESISRYRNQAKPVQEPMPEPHETLPVASNDTSSVTTEFPEPSVAQPGEAATMPRPEEASSLFELPLSVSGNEQNAGFETAEAAPQSDQHAAIMIEEVHQEEAQPVSAGSQADVPELEHASASYRVDPSGPSEFRFSSVLEEEETRPKSEEAAVPEPESSEEIHPHLVPAGEAGDSLTDSVPEQSLAVEYQELTDSAAQPGAETQEAQYVEAGAADTLVPINDAPLFAEEEAEETTVFSPGLGHIEEEIIDEEEYDFEPFHAHADEHDLDDLEEETLENRAQAELGDIVRDTHLEQRVHADPAPAASEDLIEADEEGETEEEFEESGAETETSVSEPQPSREARPDLARRGRQRRSRRPGGGNRRASAQTTNLPIISELLKQGQEILVQIAKEPIAKKGARITSHIALPGRFLVFMPTVNHVGVSRKISSDEERQRLKRILTSEKGAASGGFIVRTAADGASEEDLRADIRFLINLWNDIRQRADEAKAPALIYHDLNLVERILRDQVSDNFSTIWVDNETDYERIVRFLNRFQPSLVRRVKLYTKETPLFEQFGIQDEISKALKSKVWLKSGGSIVINQTEALVAIDINTGKYVGKTARLEDTILKTNLDAIPEIVRQIRLRDLGGIIVIDFIDMDERKNRHKVMLALEEELKNDRAPSKVLQFNDFGLVAITRKRVKQSLERTLSLPCEVCAGTGMVKSPTTVCNEIYIELRKMQRHLERNDVLLRVHPEVVKTLKANNGRWLNEFEEMLGKTIIVKSDPALHPEQFDVH